jgi:hypothetical protein
LPEQFQEYEKRAKPQLAKINKKGASRAEKNKASEQIGTDAVKALNAKSQGESLAETDKKTEEFSGSGVFDGVIEDQGGKTVVLEAKGGTSHFGTRRVTGSKKRVTQCTVPYVKEIATTMAKSQYKGRHPMRGCHAHRLLPRASCPNCIITERRRRRNAGRSVQGALKKGKLQKLAGRGGYKGKCLEVPKVIVSYGVTSTGNVKPVDVS